MISKKIGISIKTAICKITLPFPTLPIWNNPINLNLLFSINRIYAPSKYYYAKNDSWYIYFRTLVGYIALY